MRGGRLWGGGGRRCSAGGDATLSRRPPPLSQPCFTHSALQHVKALHLLRLITHPHATSLQHAACRPGSAFRPADPLPPSDCSCNDKVSAVVCGSSGRLFDNSCRLECAQEQLLGTCGERSADECARVCRGAAKPPPPDGSMCIDLWAPVCGKAGGVFANKCVAEVRGAGCCLVVPECCLAAVMSWPQTAFSRRRRWHAFN